MTSTPTYERANLLQRSVRKFAATGPGAWLFGTVLQRLDRPIYRLTRGRHTLANLLSGLPVVLLTTTGARSRLARSCPVVGLPTADGLAVIASNFGRRQHPGWYHNLHANPDAHITVRGKTTAVRGVLASGDVRARIWREGLTVYPGWSSYERRAAGRTIAIFVLVPRPGDSAGTPDPYP